MLWHTGLIATFEVVDTVFTTIRQRSDWVSYPDSRVLSRVRAEAEVLKPGGLIAFTWPQ